MDDRLLFAVFICGGTLLIAYHFIKTIKQRKRNLAKQEESDSNKKDAPSQPEYTTVTVNATVIDQTCCVKTIGYKTPKTVKEFTVIFQTENGDILKLNVPEEMYDGFEKGQTGVLSLVDGELYGFDLKE